MVLRWFDHTDDDGESETRVEARLITALDAGSDSDRRSDRLREGDKVEADYRGRGKFYKGKISRDRGDDTYDIAYDDGERETRVSKRLIRKQRGSSRSRSRSRSRSPSRGRMRVGTRVEARYRGRSKKYPGKISRVHADGSFDVAYVCLGARNYFWPSFSDGRSHRTMASPKRASRPASSRRSTAGAAIPTAEAIGSAREIRSKLITAGGADTTPGR